MTALIGRPPTFTPAERLERRRACKAISDRKRNGKRAECERKRRAVLAAKGMTCRGRPKPDPRQLKRNEIQISVNAAKRPAPCTKRAETMAEFLARGGQIERLPCAFTPATAYPRCGLTTRAIAGHQAHSA